MTTRTTLFTGLLLASVSLATLTSAYGQSLEQAVSQAVATHPDVAAAANERNAIEQEVERARAGYKPTVDVEAAAGFESSNNTSTRARARTLRKDSNYRDMFRTEARATVSQMLFDGMATSGRVDQQLGRLSAADTSVMEAKERVALSAVEGYINVLRARELVTLARANVDTHKQYVEMIKSRVDGGRGNSGDLRQAEGRMALAEANKLAFEGELLNAEAIYTQAVGAAPGGLNNPMVPYGSVPQSVSGVVSRAVQNNPAVKTSQNNVAAAAGALREAKAAFYPRLDAEGTGALGNNLDGISDENNELQAMLRARWNLYRGGADQARERERIARAEGAKAEIALTQRQVEEAAAQAYYRLATATNRIAPLNTHVASAETSRDAYRSQFDLGQRTLLDLLDSEIELFNARTALINARYAQDFSAYEVLANMGDLVAMAGGSATMMQPVAPQQQPAQQPTQKGWFGNMFN